MKIPHPNRMTPLHRTPYRKKGRKRGKIYGDRLQGAHARVIRSRSNGALPKKTRTRASGFRDAPWYITPVFVGPLRSMCVLVRSTRGNFRVERIAILAPEAPAAHPCAKIRAFVLFFYFLFFFFFIPLSPCGLKTSRRAQLTVTFKGFCFSFFFSFFHCSLHT